MKKPPKKITDLRKRVDTLDRVIINMIARRLRVVKKINTLKKKYSYPLYDARREAVIKNRRKK